MKTNANSPLSPSRRSVLGLAASAAVVATFSTTKVLAQSTIRNVVLVHGAWADGSCWTDVIGLLQAAGLNVTSVQNPLTSLSDDVAATKRALSLQDGPTVLVGHSWGGTVISEAGVDPKVVALVYVAARAPDAGEDFGALSAKYPTMPARAGIQKANGFLRLSEEAYLKHFAGDVERSKARILYASQQPVSEELFAGKTTVAAWKTKPSFYAVSTADQTTSPDLERFLASRMKATTVELAASHVSMISHSKEITELILAAARGTS